VWRDEPPQTNPKIEIPETHRFGLLRLVRDEMPQKNPKIEIPETHRFGLLRLVRDPKFARVSWKSAQHIP
jgi:hypothetical protein